ncbi:MAG: Asp-tRNA(Asn)/Glu-tRNA(Gln) amidotransferase subunit GatA [Candidatus Saccharibacteria bacterium]
MNQPATIHEALAGLAAGEITAEQLVRDHLDRIDAVDDGLQTVLTRLDEAALEAARDIDRRRAAGDKLGVLAGIPFTAKDMFLVAGTRTTAASKILDEFIAPYTGTAMQALLAEDAVLIAKVNQDEFAHGGSTEYSAYGPSKNPHELGHVPGGSSGGSAAAVAAGIGLFSLGTDTGGSIRQPAAYCGVVGVKPTYGAVSRYGVVAMASSLDVVGPLARTVADAALVTEIIAGRDTHDATTIDLESTDFSSAARPKKVGLIEEYMNGLEESVRLRYEAVLAELRQAGWAIETVSLPRLVDALPCYYIVTPSEISSNLERYDGIRYGSSERNVDSLEEVYRQTRGRHLGPEVQRRVLTGTYTLSAGYYDAYYKKAMQVRTLIIEDFRRAFGEFDILIGPTTPDSAFAFGANTHDPVQMYLADVMTVGANLAGVPAISLPIAGVKTLPLGLQLIAPQKGETALFAAARDAESILNTRLEVTAV